MKHPGGLLKSIAHFAQLHTLALLLRDTYWPLNDDEFVQVDGRER